MAKKQTGSTGRPECSPTILSRDQLGGSPIFRTRIRCTATGEEREVTTVGIKTGKDLCAGCPRRVAGQ